MIDFLKKNKYFLLLILIALISHIQWFNPFSILNYSDWSYWPSEAVDQLYYSYGTWINFFNFGLVNIQIPFNFFNLIWSLITNLGLSYDIATKVTFLVPIAILGFISPYLLFKKLTKNELVSFVTALFYGTTTYYLIRQTSHLPIAFVYAFVPFIFLYFLIALEKNKLVNWVGFIIIYWISICYEVRIAYIVAFILVIYFFFLKFRDIKKYWRNILLSGLLLVGLNIFWLLPILFGGFSKDISVVANRGLFGSSLFDISHAITISNDPWTGGLPNNQFIKQPILLYFWLIPLIAFSVLIFKNVKYNKEIIFFGIISLIGIFLSKQEVEPLADIYLWLYNNFPGFNLFREASKFYLLTAFGYSGLISYGLLSLRDHKNKLLNKYIFSVFAIIIIAISLLNIKPFITGEIGTMFISKKVPADYIVLNNFIIKQPDYFRTFWIPTDSRWGIFTNQKPKVSSVAVTENGWKNILETYNENHILTKDRIMNIFRQQFADSLFDNSSIKYVVVPIQDKANDDDFFIDYGGNKNANIREWYISELDKVKWLKKIDIGTKDLKIYENINYKPHIFSLNEYYSFNSNNNLDKKYNLINNEFKTGFSFDVNNKNNNLTVINNLFENIKNSDVGDKVKNEFELVNQNSNSIYINKNKIDFYYSYNQENHKLTIFKKNSARLIANGKNVNEDSEMESIFQSNLSPDKKYYFLSGTKLISLLQNREQKLGTINQNIHFPIYSTNNQNLISNASFQKGLWSKKVDDCNAYDNNPILDIKLGTRNIKNADNRANIIGNNKKLIEDDNYLQLEAARHIACTSNSFNVRSNTDYLFSFDYQSPNANNAGYYLQFNDKEKTVIRERIFISDKNWHTYSKKIESPKGATSARLYLYAYSIDEKLNIINRYDNFSLLTLEKENDVKIEYKPEFIKQVISYQKKNIFKYSDPLYNYENIIPNGSFEKGLWQEKVGDCLNYDANGDLRMKIGNVASDGSRSLQLESKKHIACTSTSFPVSENSFYLFSFDYQSPNTKKGGYYLQFNDKNSTVSREIFDIKEDKWHKYEKKIQVPLGATSAMLYVYAYESDKRINNIVRYDNFKFFEIPDLVDKYYLVSNPNLKLKNPEKVNFELVNPTKKIVHVKGATTPFFLAMSESYHPQWQVEMNDSKVQGSFNSWIPFVSPVKISDNNHLKLNDVLNAWFVDTTELCKSTVENNKFIKSDNGCIKNSDGTYDMELVIEFWPQRWFYFGLLISGITLLGCLCYLGFMNILRNRGGKYGNKNDDNKTVDLSISTVEAGGLKDTNVNNVQMHEIHNIALHLIAGFIHKVRQVWQRKLPLLIVLSLSAVALFFWGTISAFLWMLFLMFLLYRWDSRIPCTLAIFLLLICPILLSLYLETEAEQIAVYAYILIVITIVLQMVEFWREGLTMKSH